MTGRGRPKRTTKRPNGAGSHYLKNGRHYVSGTVPGLGRKAVSAATEAEAWAKFTELLKANERFDMTLGDRTVADLAAAWLKVYAESGVEQSTLGRRRERIEYHIVNDERIAGILAAKLRPEQVNDWLRAKRDAGYLTAGGVRKEYTSVAQFRTDLIRIFDWAVGQRFPGIDWNPARASSKVTVEALAEAKRTLNPEQAKRLITELAGTTRRYAAFALIGLFTGARPGEIHGLSWDCIEWDTNTLTFRSALKRASGGRPIGLGALKTAKRTGEDTRIVRVPDLVMHALKRERELQDELRQDWWPKEWSGLVFLGETGRPPSSSNMLRDLRRIVADAGLDEIPDLDVYELRHTCASILDDAGVPLSEILDQLGWKDDRMFRKHYRHRMSPITGDAAVALWGNMIDG